VSLARHNTERATKVDRTLQLITADIIEIQTKVRICALQEGALRHPFPADIQDYTPGRLG
jgi:hypothetical protein